jgi:hypothetical protein
MNTENRPDVKIDIKKLSKLVTGILTRIQKLESTIKVPDECWDVTAGRYDTSNLNCRPVPRLRSLSWDLADIEKQTGDTIAGEQLTQLSNLLRAIGDSFTDLINSRSPTNPKPELFIKFS